MKSLLLVVILIFTGCSVTSAPVTEYRIDPQVKFEVSDAHTCKDKSLKITQVFSSTSLMSKKMKYAEDDLKENSFSQSEWAISPTKAITKELVKSIRASQLFSTVTSFKSRSRSDIILETSVEDFMQYFNTKSKKSYVSVVVSMTLVDSKSSKTLETKTFEKKVDVSSFDAYGGVKALNTAFEILLIENNKWLESLCK